MKTCTFKDCDRKHAAKGLCSSHYAQKLQGKELTPLRSNLVLPRGTLCKFKGCDKEFYAKALCNSHYNMLRKGQELRALNLKSKRQISFCKVEECDKRAHALEYCITHYKHVLYYGEIRIKRKYRSKDDDCKFEGCDRAYDSHGYCSAHAAQFRKGKVLTPILNKTRRVANPVYCLGKGCERRSQNRGYCTPCAKKYRIGTYAKDCSFEGCNRQHAAKNLCAAHYAQLKKGKPLEKIINGVEYKIGRYTAYSTGRKSNGYHIVRCPEYQGSNARNMIAEHILVVADHIDRPLLSHENVHHINGLRDDNRIENLELWSTSQPAGQRVKDKLAWAREMIELYEELE